MDLKIEAIKKEIENTEKELSEWGKRVLRMVAIGRDDPDYKDNYVEYYHRLKILKEVHDFLIGNESYKLWDCYKQIVNER